MDADRLEENGLVDLVELTPEELEAAAMWDEFQAQVAAWELELDQYELQLVEKLETLAADIRLKEQMDIGPRDEWRRFFFANVLHRLGECVQIAAIVAGAGRLRPMVPPPEDGSGSGGGGDDQQEEVDDDLHQPLVVDAQPRPTRRPRATRIPWSDLVQ